MENILLELSEKKNVRANLSALRQFIKEQDKKEKALKQVEKQEALYLSFLKDEDAKTRKNAALLLGDLMYQNALEDLYEAYTSESQMFVKASYLQAIGEMDAREKLPYLKRSLECLLNSNIEPENQKHVDEEIRALRKILIRTEGIKHHTADICEKKVKVILITNRTQRETVRRMIDCGQATLHPLGVQVETEQLEKLLQLRTFREVVFPLQVKGFISSDPIVAANSIWESDVISLLNDLHVKGGEYYFRIECKSAMDLQKRSTFTRKMAEELERISSGQLINSTSDYEVELRLIANKEGMFFPCLKLLTIKDTRFDYRKNAIATSIHPSTAALIMEIAKDYLRENAQIIDPFCGVGTMLIERNKKVPAREIYGVDLFGEAISYARENTECAGMHVNYIHRDFMDFKHNYLFDEIVTNMPQRGQRTKQEMDAFYHTFFEKAKTHLSNGAVIIMYTNEMGFVKKQLRLHNEFKLLQETCLQQKNDFYLMIISYKG